MPVTWDDAAHKKMLFAMVTLLQSGKTASWDNVAAMMGEEYKANAIRQQWPRLKKEFETSMGQPADDKNDGESSTPKKRGGKKAVGEKSSGKRKSSGKSKKEGEEDLGDDDEEESPSKKMKMKVKAEESEVEEV